MFTLILALALAADPAPEVLDFIDPDGDGSITDAEFAVGCKAMATLNKSKKKPDVELLQKLDPDGDGKLSDEEILQLAAEGREADFVVQQVLQTFDEFDSNKDGEITKQESDAILARQAARTDSWNIVKRCDANKDGTVSRLEVVACADSGKPGYRELHHVYKRNPPAWRNAAQTILRIGGPDKRINKLEAGKIKEIHAAFDEIDADADGRIKVIELFNWMCAQ